MTKFASQVNKQLKRYEIPAWEGLNTMVADNLVKRGELAYTENARSTKIGWLEKRAGHSIFGNNLSATANYGLYDFINGSHNLIRVSTVGAYTHIYRYSPASNSWYQLTTAGVNSMSPTECDFTTAADRCFIVNGVDNNRYIEPNASTIVDSTNASGFFFNSPKARLVNKYKGRIYLADYLRPDGSRERTGICFSSPLLGIVSLVSGDQTAPLTTINVTDTKYIKVGASNDSLDVYRGGTLIGVLTVTAKTENTITVSSFGTNLLSNDELWISGTKNGEKIYRWDNKATGIDVRQYDSFPNASEEDITLMANVGNNMLIITPNSISAYNGSFLQPLDLEVGCVAKKTFTKIMGQGIFLHYTGLYSTTGGAPKLLSAKIQQIFDNADPRSLERATAAVKNYSYFCYIGDVMFYNSDGTLKKQLKDVVIEYNLRQNNFFQHTDIPMSHFIKFVNGSQEVLLFAKRSGTALGQSEQVYVGENVSVTVL